MRRITGTHVYSQVKCARLAALDLHLPRSERRAVHPWEEFAAKRGRDFEDVYVAELRAVAPEYPERDFEAGLQATMELLRSGAPLVHQAVLMDDNRLGLPDLLRKVPGESVFGDFHYEVLDVKTSGQPRSDQVLQVAFYSRLLAGIQQRLPDQGALILKDRREERFDLADFVTVCADVERTLLDVRQVGRLSSVRPFLQLGCDSCHWNHQCLPELASRQDLSLVQGATPGVRTILEGLGCKTVEDLATFHPDSARARGQLDAALFRRLRRAAQAAVLGKPVAEVRPRGKPLEPFVLLHALFDPFADRALAFGLWQPAPAGSDRSFDAGFVGVTPGSQQQEWAALHELLDQVPRRAHILHFGQALSRWHEAQAFERQAEVGYAQRFVDMQRRLRAAVLFPAPVFTLADFVRHGLAVDPHRHGRAAAAAMWVSDDEDGGRARLLGKLRADLHDLYELKRAYLQVSTATAVTTREGEFGSDTGTTTAAIPGS